MKYSKERIDLICKYLEQGMTQKHACEFAGLSEETFHQWKRNKPEFTERLKVSAMKCLHRNLALIQKAAITQWTAGAWWCERNYPELYAIRQRLEHTGANGQPIQSQVTTDLKIDLSKFDTKALEKLAKELSANQPTIKKDEQLANPNPPAKS